MSCKLSIDDVRTQPARERLYQTVAERPGVTFMELVHSTNGAVGSTSYHLYVLERHGLVYQVKSGRSVHYYVVGAVNPRDALLDAETSQPTRSRVYQTIVERPGICLSSLARSLGTSHQRVGYHVYRLRLFGLVRTEPDPVNRRFVRFSAAEPATARTTTPPQGVEATG